MNAGRRNIRLQVNYFIVLALFSGLLASCAQQEVSVDGRVFDKQKAVAVSIQAGIEYIKAGVPEAAQRHLDRAIQLDPHSAEAHNALALLYQQTGDVQLEEAHLKKALSENSQYSQARNNYGSFLYRQGKYKAALKQLTYAAEDTHYDKRDLAYENMGHCAARLGNLALAEQSFTKALRLNPTLVDDYLELAQLAFAQQQWQKSNNYLKQFSTARRQTARSLWLGIQLARQLNLKDDLSSYELALKNLYPNSAEYQLYQQSLTGSPSPHTPIHP